MTKKNPKQTPNQNQTQDQTEADLDLATGKSETAHLESIVVDDFEGGAADDGFSTIDENGNVIDDIPPEEDGQISKEAFYTVFKTIFAVPGMMMPDFAPVAIQEDEEQAGRAASDAIYGLLEIYYPEGLLPGGDTLAHLLVAGPFIAGKVMIVRAILQARQAQAQVQPQAQAQEAEEEAHGGE